MMSQGPTRRPLRLLFLEILSEYSSITLEKLVEDSYRVICSDYAIDLPLDLFIDIAITNLKEMYITKNNWIYVDFQGHLLRSRDIGQYFNWNERLELQLRISLRGMEIMEGGSDYNKNKDTSASSPQVEHTEEAGYFDYDDMIRLIDRIKNPPKAKNIEDERAAIARQIKNRRGQSQFRSDLIDAYGQCLISGCKFKPILEAAHITPYCLGGTFDIENGLLLRSDIHTLFDLGLVTICTLGEPMIIKIDELLYGTEYEEFNNTPLLIPAGVNYSPDKAALDRRRSEFGLDYLCH